jgi:hypothetical protein
VIEFTNDDELQIDNELLSKTSITNSEQLTIECMRKTKKKKTLEELKFFHFVRKNVYAQNSFGRIFAIQIDVTLI